MSANSSRIGLKIFALLVVITAAGAVAWFSFRPLAKVAVVISGPAQSIVPGTVAVTPEKVSEIKSEADGRLIQSALAPGLVVKEGDTLAQIDATDIDIDIKHFESELAAAKATNEANDKKAELGWKTTAEEFAENERLHKIQSLADVPFTKLQREFDGKKEEQKLTKVSNEQKVENLEHTLEGLRSQKKKMTIVAPFDGVVATVMANKGDLIANKQPLATLITTSRIVTGKISEENFSQIQVGQKATVKFLTYGDKTFEAKVTKKLPTAEEGTQRYLVYLDVSIPVEMLLPNLTGDLAVVVGEHDAQALIPRRAIKDGKFVYVVEGGRVVRREVEMGFTSLTKTEITKGLRPGEQVIVDELDTFADGDRVRVELAK